jgi:hypothetical protein
LILCTNPHIQKFNVIIRRGQIEKITLSKSLSGENVEHSNKGVLITATEEITVFGVNKETHKSNDELRTLVIQTYNKKELSLRMTFNLLSLIISLIYLVLK